MDQWLLAVIGGVVGLLVLAGVFLVAVLPKRSWMAPPSGRTDNSMTGWNGWTDG